MYRHAVQIHLAIDVVRDQDARVRLPRASIGARLDADAVSRLPALLGGEASNDLLMPCPPFSKHDRADLEACGEPVFVHDVPLEATYM